MARKDDVKMLFDFMIELLKDENEVKDVNKPEEEKVLIAESKPKPTKYDIFDVPRIKTIMDKMDAKEHDDAIVKRALTVQSRDYKKEIDELKEMFNQRILKEDKLVDENGNSLSGNTSQSTTETVENNSIPKSEQIMNSNLPSAVKEVMSRTSNTRKKR